MSIDQGKSFIPVRIALLTVSDTRSLADDKSGSVLAERIETSGHKVVSRELIRDDRQEIRSQLENWVKSENVDVVISTGGTGLTGRDVTVEAHRDIYEKEICLSPIPSLAMHATNINSSYGIPPNFDWVKLWNENEN